MKTPPVAESGLVPREVRFQKRGITSRIARDAIPACREARELVEQKRSEDRGNECHERRDPDLCAFYTGGCYGAMPCLGRPTSCLPNYPASAPAFLEPGLSSITDKNGYRRSFVPGPPANSPLCFQAFAYTALPAWPGETGLRSFCGDDTGRICVNDDGGPFVVSGGRCPQDCKALQ